MACWYLPGRWGKALEFGATPGSAGVCTDPAEHEHADGGRGDARRLNKEWTNVNGAGL